MLGSRKTRSQKTLENAAESHTSTAHSVGTLLTLRDLCLRAATMFLIFAKVLLAVD